MFKDTEGIMRNLLLSLMLLVLAVPAYGAVDGLVTGSAMDANGNIVVKVIYTIDGVEVESPYPKEDGHYVHVFRMAYTNLENTTLADFVDQNVKQHCESLTQRKANAVENAKIDLSSVVGRKVTVDTIEQQVSPTKALVLSTAGKVSEKALTPPPEYVDPVQAKLDEIKAKVDKIDTATATVAEVVK